MRNEAMRQSQQNRRYASSDDFDVMFSGVQVGNNNPNVQLHGTTVARCHKDMSNVVAHLKMRSANRFVKVGGVRRASRAANTHTFTGGQANAKWLQTTGLVDRRSFESSSSQTKVVAPPYEKRGGGNRQKRRHQTADEVRMMDWKVLR